MARFTAYSLLAFALSGLVIASPLILRRQSSVPAPSNVAPGTVTTGCATYHTAVSGDTCFLLEGEFNITDISFHTLNLGVNAQCTNLIADLAYCVEAAANSTTPPPTGVTPPSNVAPGTITTGCAQYFTVTSGLTCDLIDNEFNITLAQFLTFNTAVNSGCTNLIAEDAYCVQSA